MQPGFKAWEKNDTEECLICSTNSLNSNTQDY
jgi:hypothetical protein